jgi:hypothetical protein
MAFIATNLNPLVQGNGFTLWHYKTADTGNTVDTIGYFNGASNIMAVNDVLIIVASDRIVISFVLTNAAGVVDITDGLTVTATNTR